MPFLCPQCRSRATVVETRAAPKGQRRRYRCGKGHGFTTLEAVAQAAAGGSLAPEQRALARAEVLDQVRRAIDRIENE